MNLYQFKRRSAFYEYFLADSTEITEKNLEMKHLYLEYQFEGLRRFQK
jgi:hypothetical protein